MEIACLRQTKKSSNILEDLKFEVELRAQNNEWQEESGGLFGLKKDTVSLDENEILGWLDRNEFTCGAIQLPQSIDELFLVMKTGHLNFFESVTKANIR